MPAIALCYRQNNANRMMTGIGTPRNHNNIDLPICLSFVMSRTINRELFGSGPDRLAGNELVAGETAGLR